MAKYDVTYSCGHSGTVKLVGKKAERERKIRWYAESGLCSDCYAQEQATQRDRNNSAAADQNAAVGLPELQGTPKQIAWAEKIRHDELSRLNTLLAINRSTPNLTDEQKKQLAAFEDTLGELNRETSAAWWIEHRNDVPAYILAQVRRRLG